MSMVEEQQTSPQESGDSKRISAPAAGNVDKIRDILFGTQMRDYEKRFNRLEEKMQKDTADLREDIRSRLSSLETYIKNELESISQRLSSEQNERFDSAKNLSAEISETARSFEKKIGQLEDQTTKNSRDLREQILEQSTRLSEQIREQHDRLFTHLEKAVNELTLDKVDRASLADFFTEMALRLNNEFRVEGMEDLSND